MNKILGAIVLSFIFTSKVFAGCIEGNCKNGKGTYKWGLTKIDKYVGEWKHGKQHGQGVFTWHSGASYKGEYLEGHMHNGTYIKNDGSKYIGKFKPKKMTNENGYTWYVDTFNGQGTLVYPDGETYEGEWKYDEMHGKGKLTYPNGDIYIGEWVYGKRKDGQGKLISFDGDIYEGEFEDEEKHGKGKLTSKDGIYIGDFEWNSKHGKGTLTYKNGDIYSGDWKNDKRDGQGILKFINDAEYKGEFIDDRIEGVGVMTFADGSFKKGKWKDGELYLTDEELLEANDGKKYFWGGKEVSKETHDRLLNELKKSAEINQKKYLEKLREEDEDDKKYQANINKLTDAAFETKMCIMSLSNALGQYKLMLLRDYELISQETLQSIQNHHEYLISFFNP